MMVIHEGNLAFTFPGGWSSPMWMVSTSVTVVAKIPEAVLQEDAKLLMWYDQAVTRTEDSQ